MENRDKPIGVFDSGIGGLTVVKEIFRQLPNEEIVYFGDTARFPYGTRSPERVRSLSLGNSRFLLDFDVKLIIVACNTASSVALGLLKEKLPIPVIGVVKPGSFAAAKATRNGRIGIIGTTATIASGSYQRELKSLNDQISTYAVACPLFVSLAEEGWTIGPVARMVAEAYLADLRLKNIDTLILGCTHYPLLKNVIAETLGEKVKLIDSAEATIKETSKLLTEIDGHRKTAEPVYHRFLVSDSPERFVEVGQRFLQSTIKKVLKVSLEDLDKD